jgi:hypothetical protein
MAAQRSRFEPCLSVARGLPLGRCGASGARRASAVAGQSRPPGGRPWGTFDGPGRGGAPRLTDTMAPLVSEKADRSYARASLV